MVSKTVYRKHPSLTSNRAGRDLGNKNVEAARKLELLLEFTFFFKIAYHILVKFLQIVPIKG